MFKITGVGSGSGVVTGSGKNHSGFTILVEMSHLFDDQGLSFKK